MYLFDRAAWMTSDDLRTRLPESRHGEIGGWIVTPSATGLRIEYFGKEATADRIIYSADLAGTTLSNAKVYPAVDAPPLQEPALRMARALRAAKEEMGRNPDWQPCTSGPFNTIVLPPERDGTVPVYFLTPQIQINSVPFGGHYEVDIGPDGRTAFKRAFAKSCITMTQPPFRVGQSPAMLFLTHTLDPHPTEIHVFQQFYVGVPLVVGTGPRTIWKVENGAVEDASDMLP